MTQKIRKPLLLFAVFTLAVTLMPRASSAVQFTAETARAFDQYITGKETQANRDLAARRNFLFIDALPQTERDSAYARLKNGEILAQRDAQCSTPACTSVPGGLIHDWIGIVFVPGISLEQALAALQDYDRDSDYYRAEVLKSKLLAKSGDEFHIYLRLKQVHIITVVLDTEYDVRYARIDRNHVCARSYSVRVEEVNHAGSPDERDEPPGDGHGYLWRLDSYWRFYQADGGVYIQCNAVSLTRDLPAGVGWLIGSFIEKIPAESLHSTLAETRAALLSKFNLPQESSR
jgi:hypothetical protein